MKKYTSVDQIVIRAKDSRLTGLSIVREKGKEVMVVCRCTCGNVKTIRLAHVISGRVRSCGCLYKEGPVHHGYARRDKSNATYHCWVDMRARCYNERREQYRNYGARGISICTEWDVFENFLRDMGERPSNTSLDRIDVDGNYQKNNCRWASQKQQCRNKRNNVLVTFEGVKLPLAEVAERVGMPYGRFYNRIVRFGWSVEKAATQAKPKEHGLITYEGEKITVKELSRRIGVPYPRLWARIFICGWSVEDAVQKPSQRGHV